MAAGLYTDFKIKDEEFYAGLNETVQDNADAFNAASGNCIRLVPTRLKGNYEKEAFFKNVSGLVRRRNVASVSAAADLKLEQDEIVGVKCSRIIGPVAQTIDAFRRLGIKESEMSFVVGQQAGAAVTLDMVNSALYALTGAMKGITAIRHQPYYKANGSTRSITPAELTTMLYKFGDAQNRIRTLVMHSVQAKDLNLKVISDKVDPIFAAWVADGNDMATTLGRKALITDSAALQAAAVGSSLEGYSGYHVLGLVEDAIVVTQSEEQNIQSEVALGKENLLIRIQGEYSFNVKVKGFAYGTGGVNPTDANLGATANWSQVAADEKAGPGVTMYCRAA